MHADIAARALAPALPQRLNNYGRCASANGRPISLRRREPKKTRTLEEGPASLDVAHRLPMESTVSLRAEGAFVQSEVTVLSIGIFDHIYPAIGRLPREHALTAHEEFCPQYSATDNCRALSFVR